MVKLQSLTVLCGFLVAVTHASAFEIGLPADCTVGQDCFIQSYVDRDPGPGVRDYACGAQGYDGHEGTDFRLRTTADTAKNVPVLAVAPGVVIGVRDGMADRLVETDRDRAAVGVKECGNGVRIDHGEGWATQVCHMRRGSVAVKPGDRVERGTPLGAIGYSGMAAFPHVHLSVTHDGAAVDPFLTDMDAACGASGPSLWAADIKEALGYRRGALLAVGLANGPVALEELRAGSPLGDPRAETPAVAYGWAINLEKGDRLDVRLERDGAVIARNAATLDRNKAEYMLFAGKKAPAGGWPAGAYTASVTVLRDGKEVIAEKSEPMRLN